MEELQYRRQSQNHRCIQLCCCSRSRLAAFNKVTSQANQIEIKPFQQQTANIAALNVGESQFFLHADPQMIKWMAQSDNEYLI